MLDLRFALRALSTSLGFTLVAIGSLALGIGATSAAYAVTRAVLLETLPVHSPGELYAFGWTNRGQHRIRMMSSTSVRDEASGRQFNSNVSLPLYRQLQSAAGDAAEVIAFHFARSANVVFADRARLAAPLLVSGNFFSTLGVGMELGRPIGPSDDRPGASAVAVLSHQFWLRAFGGSSDAIGRFVQINGATFTVVGVSAPGFYGVSRGGFFPSTDLFVPLSSQPLVAPLPPPMSRSLLDVEDLWWLQVMARVPPAADLLAVENRLKPAFRQVAAVLPVAAAATDWDVRLVPAPRGVDVLSRGLRRPLGILAAVAVLVMLLACVNVANLLLARGMARQRHLAIRLALGATSWQLIRVVLAEGVLLAAGGAAGGVLVGYWGGRVLLTSLAGSSAMSVPFDIRLVAVTMGLAAAALALFAVVPAVRAVRGRASWAQAARDARGSRLVVARSLLVLQVAISLPILTGTALLLRTLYNLGSADLGFDPHRLLAFRLDPAASGYLPHQIDPFYERVLARIRAIPGVTSATLCDVVPLTGVQNNGKFQFQGADPQNVRFMRVGPDYFETLGIPLLTGRGISVGDGSTAAGVAVVNRAAARLFPSSEAARRITMLSEPPAVFDVVGIVGDSRYTTPRESPGPIVYLPHGQGSGAAGPKYVLVRTSGTAGGLTAALEHAVADLDHTIPVADLRTQVERIARTLATERTLAQLLAVFAALALFLAAIGLHGVTTCTVARRKNEIGVRMALGATRPNVLWLVLRQVVALTGIGLILGVPCALAAAGLLQTMLYGVGPADPWSLGAAAALMATTALLAGLVPARRAATLDPLATLHES